MTVAVLFARHDSVYKSIPGCDVYDMERDARTWPGGAPVIAHPPCRAWGALRHFAKPRPDEKALAMFAVDQVRRWGGVLEHPAASTLWPFAQLPDVETVDSFGGWTLPIDQDWFGHRAEKRTKLYIVGLSPRDLPPLPFKLEEPSHVVAMSKTRGAGNARITKGHPKWRPECSKAERERTPPDLARWLVDLAIQCRR